MMRKNRTWLWAGICGVVSLTAVTGFFARPTDAATPPPATPPTGAAAPAKPAGSPANAATPAADVPRVATIHAFLNKHCVSCHNPEKKKADLILDAYTSQPAIVKGRKVFDSVLKMTHSGEMPPDGKKKPTVPEMDAFFAAVNGLYADADRNAKPDPGRVTVRRLNRTEYNNTIRDLLGVEVNPADDFPADDIGHGFDNIGDVLTVSPVLMERYLGAAELVADKTLVLEAPKPVGRHQGGRYLEPAGPRVPETKFRPVPKGAVNTPFRLDLDGDYFFKTSLYAKSPDGQKVRATLLVDGKEIATFDVTSDNDKKPMQVRHPVKLPAGQQRFAVQLANPSDGAEELDIGQGRRRRDAAAPKPEPAKPQENVRVLHVEYISLEGPADTRPMPHRKFLSPANPAAPKAEQTRQVLTAFVTRAYRRPATKDEVDRLVKLVDQVEAGGDKWEVGLRMAIQAVLVSPKFLFRLELDDRPEAPEMRAIDEYALASRLSYFLWSSMPDDELFAMAAKKQLTANLEPQVKRMLQNPKARALVDNFAMQWLQLKRLRSYQPDAKTYPNFDEQLRNAMAKETELFVEAIIKEDRSIVELLDADFTFLNERLARHYGIADTNGNPLYQKPIRPQGERISRDQFVRVSLPPGGARGGLLTQASVLTVTSNPTRTSPVKRGKWVLEQLLGTPPPPPPPDVPELEEDGKAITAGSLRKRLEMHRENPACASCHAKMDPLGFAFENFDGIGAYRSKDGTFDIDASGTLPDGKSFKGAPELKTILKDQKDLLTSALADKLMTYALGRGLEYYDTRSVNQVVKGTASDNYKFSRMVVEIVKSDPFRMRRGLTAE